jgi:uncharacterized protein
MKVTIISSLIAVALIGAAIVLVRGGFAPTDAAPPNNVSIVDGTQIVEIRAKGGYRPRASQAKAGMPTVLRFNTNGTFDCSSSIRIPSMNISRVLPPSGSTDIAIGERQPGTLSGSCGMGMYPFEIIFQD